MYGGMQEFIPDGFKTHIFERTSSRRNKHDSGFYTALCFAAEKGDEEICDIILNSNIDADLEERFSLKFQLLLQNFLCL